MSHKYIKHSNLGFIVFKRTDNVTHAEMARLMCRHYGTIISAGFVRFKDGVPTCYGRSESLGLDSEQGDSAEFAKQLGWAK